MKWKLITNEEFTNEILNNKLEETGSVYDAGPGCLTANVQRVSGLDQSF